MGKLKSVARCKGSASECFGGHFPVHDVVGTELIRRREEAACPNNASAPTIIRLVTPGSGITAMAMESEKNPVLMDFKGVPEAS